MQLKQLESINSNVKGK